MKREYSCPKCGNHMIKNGTTAAGKTRYICYGSTGRTERAYCYSTTDPEATAAKTPSGKPQASEKTASPKFKRALGGVKRLVITSAQNATPVNEAFLASLEHYCDINDAELIVVHPGQRDGEADTTESAWDRLLEWVQELDGLAALYGINVGIELMERKPFEFFMLPSDAKRLMAGAYQNLGLTVDLAHLNTHGNPIDLLEQINPDWISHVHLSDNTPQRVHLPLGTGKMDIGGLLHALTDRYSGLVSIEGSVPERGIQLLEQNFTYLEKLGYVRRK